MAGIVLELCYVLCLKVKGCSCAGPVPCPCSALELVMYQRDETGSRHMRIGDKISNDDIVMFVVLYLCLLFCIYECYD